MTDYTELVKALRWCSVDEYVPCTGCPMDEETHGTGCFNIMHQRAAAAIEALQAENETLHQHISDLNEAFRAESKARQDAQPHWVSVEERKPPEYTDVWCAVYTTDIICMEDGETLEEAIENRQREAARNPRMTLGSYSEDEGWTDGYFGMPMVCRPDYWLEMTIPEPPKEVQDGSSR